MLPTVGAKTKATQQQCISMQYAYPPTAIACAWEGRKQGILKLRFSAQLLKEDSTGRARALCEYEEIEGRAKSPCTYKHGAVGFI